MWTVVISNKGIDHNLIYHCMRGITPAMLSTFLLNVYLLYYRLMRTHPKTYTCAVYTVCMITSHVYYVNTACIPTVYLKVYNISNLIMRTRLDFKSAIFGPVQGEAEDMVKMRKSEI